MKREEELIRGLPDPDAARRFLGQIAESHPSHFPKLMKNEALASDILALVSFSPLLAATLLQNPEYLWWLERKRRISGVRGKDEFVESLARFSLTNSQLEPKILFARFRRRELLRIYLRDIRRLATVTEVTEELSNLADAILESALKLARREVDNRFGMPQELDDKGRATPAGFCITALGKLGSRELNYSSDIDLLFLYSHDGQTSGTGSRGVVTNREYFVKLAEQVVKLVGDPSGEGGAYRVDLRLRPHGTLGALCLSVADTVKYCRNEARPWERQVLIRSRAAAGDAEQFKAFFSEVENLVFSKGESLESALAAVRRSKERIDLENIHRRGFNVKLGRGGIREIEFLAQALQLAYGGHDRWLRAGHTLISLSRLADRGYISETEITQLAGSYEFLRRIEHVLQMENGLQTHTIPDDPDKRTLLARRVNFASGGDFEQDLSSHTNAVTKVFSRVFGQTDWASAPSKTAAEVPTPTERTRRTLLASIEKSEFAAATESSDVLDRVTDISPHFAAMLAANPQFVAGLADPVDRFSEADYSAVMMSAVEAETTFGARLAAMRRTWSRLLLEIVVADVYEKLSLAEAKRLQTSLAEASIEAALRVTRDELADRFRTEIDALDLAILALGKLGGRGVDYDSDLDLIIVYYDPKRQIAGVTPAEFYARAVEVFSTVLSSMTRDGSLYRVDLRLRPFGSKGMSATSIDSFLDYMSGTAVVWEMLAFVKLRFVGGDASIGVNVENETRRIIHERAATIPGAELAAETLRVRSALEKERSRTRKGSDIDLKYGPGGILDIYFAVRFLQLRDNVPDNASDRSTPFILQELLSRGSLTQGLHAALLDGHAFLSELDHSLRLTIGRTTRLPLANHDVLDRIAVRMKIKSAADLLEQLTTHRHCIREAFEAVITEKPSSGLCES